ncbi:MAG: hypothetical protein WCG98_03430 [bacterium]
MTELTKTILELEQLQTMQPDFSVIKLLEREKCEDMQVVIFAKEKNTLKILTTNNFPEKVLKLTKLLDDKGYKSELFYTSME